MVATGVSTQLGSGIDVAELDDCGNKVSEELDCVTGAVSDDVIIASELED